MTPNVRWSGTRHASGFWQVEFQTACYHLEKFTQTSGVSDQAQRSGSKSNASQGGFPVKLLDEICEQAHVFMASCSFMTSMIFDCMNFTFIFVLPKTKGVSQGGNQLGLEDDRTALVSEVFTTSDNCPALHLVLQN